MKICRIITLLMVLITTINTFAQKPASIVEECVIEKIMDDESPVILESEAYK